MSEVISISSKLSAVQIALKAPKDQSGRFGKHRNVEGILESVKPLLKTNGLTLTLSNGIEAIGNKNYVVAVATVIDATGAEIAVKSYAWEGDVSRGLDAPQVTGAATSYSRKYALGGLFAIDDGQGDPDAHKEAAPETDKPKIATGPEKFKLQQLMKEKGIDTADGMMLFVSSVIGKDRVETHDEFVEVYHALTEEAE